MTGWTPALRIARRELLRAKGRSLLVLLMVLLPVAAVVAGSTLLRTSEVDTVESLPRELGTASARLDVNGGRVQQDPFLQAIGQYDAVRAPSRTDLERLLPNGSRLLPVVLSYDSVLLEAGERRRRVGAVGVDLRDAALRGPFRVLTGSAPDAPDEVAVTTSLANDGLRPGTVVHVAGVLRTVTGTVEGPRDLPYGGGLFGLPEAVGLKGQPVNRYWSTGPPVGWTAVQELNVLGVTVLSRAVVLDPPPADQVPADASLASNEQVTLAIIALIAVMAVLEVVLLAGPAFAVGARRQRRSLALLAAGGGTPSQVRRVVLAQGLLVGAVAAAVGVPLGVAIAAAARAPLTRWADAQWGPFDVAPLDLALVALLGAGTALLAALLPAFTVARQPLVAALTGRRVTAAGAVRPALLAVLLLAGGLVVTLAAVRGPHRFGGYSELGVAAGAIPVVLGAVLLAPAALALAGRAAGRLPLALRFAVRDADRQRGRTAPAVAAVTAVVAAAVALGTAAASDQEQNRREHVPSGPPGVAVVAAYAQDVDLVRLVDQARAALPGERVRTLRGVRPSDFSTAGHSEVQLCRRGERGQEGLCTELVTSVGGSLGSDLLVGQESLTAIAGQLAPGQLTAASAALRDGQVLVAVAKGSHQTGGLVTGDQVELRETRYTPSPEGRQPSVQVLRTASAMAMPLYFDGPFAPVRAVLPDRTGEALGATEVALLVGDDIGRADQDALERALLPHDDALSVQVERGYEDQGDRTVLLVLSLVTGGLVLAGTLAATSLALSEARPDLVTLGQVGARQRTRRLVAGGYALVLGVVGAVLGVAAGLVPGIAAAVPLTRISGTGMPDGYVVDVPWSLLALVLVGLPMVSAAVSALAARGHVDSHRRTLS